MNDSCSARLVRALAASLSAMGLAGCCTGDLRLAPTVTITDEAVDCEAEVAITFSVDGGPEQSEVCMMERGNSLPCSCTAYLAAETDGIFEILVRSGDGARQGSATVEVEEEACHVERTPVTIRLE